MLITTIKAKDSCESEGENGLGIWSGVEVKMKVKVSGAKVPRRTWETRGSHPKNKTKWEKVRCRRKNVTILAYLLKTHSCHNSECNIELLQKF